MYEYFPTHKDNISEQCVNLIQQFMHFLETLFNVDNGISITESRFQDVPKKLIDINAKEFRADEINYAIIKAILRL